MYQSYRAAFETANNNADFYFVSHYFADGTQLRKNYKEFVEDHRDLKGSYNYKFIDNQVTSIKALSENKFELITTEEFDFYHSLDGTTKFVREKRYLIKLVNEGIQFEEIEDLKTQQTKID